MNDIILPKRCELISDCFFRIDDWVLLCASQAIETAMNEADSEWFADFKVSEETEGKPIVADKPYKTYKGIGDLDFQAVMKIFSFRTERFMPVFEKYGLSTETDSDFANAVSKLIIIRNDIIGHLDGDSTKSKYAEMDSDEALRLIYKLREGILDFIVFLRFFPNICDNDGVPYLKKAEEKRLETEKLINIYQYNIETVIREENLNITVSEFEKLCKRVGISYSCDNDGNSFFETENYKKTVKSIKALIEEINNKPAVEQKVAPKKNKILIIAFAVVIILLLGLLIMLFTDGKKDDNQDKHTSMQATISDAISSAQSIINSGNATMQQPSLDVSPESEEPEASEPQIKGKGRLGGLIVTVDCVPSEYMVFEYENTDKNAYSFGWVNQETQVVLETADKKIYGTVSGGSMRKMGAKSEGSFNVDFDKEITGKIKKITFTNILPLNDVGLPDGDALTLRIPIEYK